MEEIKIEKPKCYIIKDEYEKIIFVFCAKDEDENRIAELGQEDEDENRMAELAQKFENNFIDDGYDDYFLKKAKKKGYNETYYNKHKTELLDKIKVKVPCDICDKLISKSNLLRHKKKCDEKA
jgi:uncharacterized membrane-anchored protein